MLGLKVEAEVVWKILIVNNNSTDETESVVAGFVDRLPLRGVVESKQGLSNARNRAVDECDTDYILWTDDDVRVPENWVQNYVNAIHEYGRPAVLGGDITPDFGARPPAWLSQNWRLVANAYAVREAPGHGVAIESGHFPFGANYAIRSDMQHRYRYDPDLGRKGGAMLSGEEESVIAAILAEPGTTGVWLGNAEVIHKIEPFRQRLSYLRAYFAGHGEVDYRLRSRRGSDETETPHETLEEPGMPLWIFRALASQYRSYLITRFLKRDASWLRAYARYAFTLGELRARRNE